MKLASLRTCVRLTKQDRRWRERYELDEERNDRWRKKRKLDDGKMNDGDEDLAINFDRIIRKMRDPQTRTYSLIGEAVIYVRD